MCLSSWGKMDLRNLWDRIFGRKVINSLDALNYTFKQVSQRLQKLSNDRVILDQLKDLLAKNIAKEQQLMSQITDWAATEQADLSAISTTLDSITTGIKALDDLITKFQNSPGTLSPEDQAALDQIQAASKALVTKAAAIDVNPPAPPSA